jgi:hypothetical protein
VDQDTHLGDAGGEWVFPHCLVVVLDVLQVLEGALVKPVQLAVKLQQGGVGNKLVLFNLDFQVKQSQNLLILSLDLHEIVLSNIGPNTGDLLLYFIVSLAYDLIHGLVIALHRLF